MGYMAKRSVASKKTLVDPLFTVPVGSEDEFTYSRESADENIIVDGEISEEEFSFSDPPDDDDLDPPDDDDDDGTTLGVPEDFEVPQSMMTLRRTASGHQVVDAIIIAEDIPGAINYEIQVTKL